MEKIQEALVLALDSTRRDALVDALRESGVARVVEAEDADGLLERVARGWASPVFVDGVASDPSAHADACLEILQLAPRTRLVALFDPARPNADHVRRRMLRAGAFAAVPHDAGNVRAIVREMSTEAEAAALPI